MDNLIVEVSGEDCKRLVREMLVVHDRVYLMPLIEKLAVRMSKKKHTCEVITPARLHEVWPKNNRPDDEIRWLANTYWRLLGETSGWLKRER